MSELATSRGKSGLWLAATGEDAYTRQETTVRFQGLSKARLMLRLVPS